MPLQRSTIENFEVSIKSQFLGKEARPDAQIFLETQNDTIAMPNSQMELTVCSHFSIWLFTKAHEGGRAATVISSLKSHAQS